MKVGNTFRIASLCSFVILLSLYVAYSAGAFDSYLVINTTQSQNNAKNESGHVQKDFINSSKKTEVFKPSENDELSLQKEEEAIQINLKNEIGKTLQFSSKSAPVFEKVSPNNEEKLFMGGSKEAEVFRPTSEKESPQENENMLIVPDNKSSTKSNQKINSPSKKKSNKNKAKENVEEFMGGSKSAPVFEREDK